MEAVCSDKCNLVTRVLAGRRGFNGVRYMWTRAMGLRRVIAAGDSFASVASTLLSAECEDATEPAEIGVACHSITKRDASTLPRVARVSGAVSTFAFPETDVCPLIVSQQKPIEMGFVITRLMQWLNMAYQWMQLGIRGNCSIASAVVDNYSEQLNVAHEIASMFPSTRSCVGHSISDAIVQRT
jgi:hypothetical protein